LRVAALAFGILAGLVASLILALGGLDVTASVGATADRQAQAIRFGLFIIGNFGFFGAALALAAPLTAGIFLVLGAIAWVGAALLMHHSTDMVLILPPSLLLIAAIFAVIAHFRRPRPTVAEEDEDPDVEIIAPERRSPERTDEDQGVGMPAFASEQRSEQVRSAFDAEPPKNNDWNPRRRPPPPPRAKPAFRPIEDEYEDDEPSGFSRFALGLSGILSFGLYAALAGAAVLIVWTLRNDADTPAATVAEAPAASSSAPALPAFSSSAEENRLPSTEPTLEPILTGEPIREVETAGAAPSTTPSELVADATTSQEQSGFGAVSMPGGPVMIPTLSSDFNNDDAAEPLPPVTASPPSLPPDEASSEEPAPVELETPPPSTPSVAAPGQPLPRSMPPQMAAMRTAPGTGPRVVATQPANTNNTGL
jgi:hypothetical protein